jgi:hypothetical protein
MMQFRTKGLAYPQGRLDACGFATRDWYNQATVRSTPLPVCVPALRARVAEMYDGCQHDPEKRDVFAEG